MLLLRFVLQIDNSEVNEENKLEVGIGECVTGLQAWALIVQEGGILYHALEIPTGH